MSDCLSSIDENENLEYEKGLEKVLKYLDHSFWLYHKSLGDLLCNKKLQNHQKIAVKKILWCAARTKHAAQMIGDDYGDEEFWNSFLASLSDQITPSGKGKVVENVD